MATKPPVELEHWVEFITPKMAKEWLDANTHNRRVSERLVLIYAEAIRENEWMLNGEPIIFDKNGTLQSGQHRLLAVIEAGKGIWSLIVSGAEPESLYSLDTGRKRRFTDVLTLRGEKDVAVLGAVVSWYWRYTHGIMDKGHQVATSTHLLKILDEKPELRDASKAARPLFSQLGVTSGLFGALYQVFADINRKEADQFFELLATGADLSSDSPIFALRRWILRNRQAEKRTRSVIYAAVTIKAWNAWRNHETPRALRWAANEPFPEAE